MNSNKDKIIANRNEIIANQDKIVINLEQEIQKYKKFTLVLLAYSW